MPYKPPVAVYDACVLYPFHLRNLLVQCAVDRLVEARWTDAIHDEWIRNLSANKPGLTRRGLETTRDLMKAVLPTADVQGYAQHIRGIQLPDADDRHVVAAAIAGHAAVIVTWNVDDFPQAEMARHRLRRETPDAFLLGLHAAAPEVVIASAANARRNLRISTPAPGEFVDALERQGLAGFGAVLRAGLTEL